MGRNGWLQVYYYAPPFSEKLCDVNPDWECSSTVKRGIRAMLSLYYEIPQEKKKNWNT